MTDGNSSAAPRPVSAVEGKPGSTPTAGGVGETPGNVPGIAAAVSALAEQHGAGGDASAPEKPRRGRPPTHGLYSKAAGSDGKNPVRTGAVEPVEKPVDGPPRPKLPPGLIARIAKAGASLADQWAVNRVKSAAIKAGVPEKNAAPVIESVRMTPEMKDLIGELTPHALAEWGADPEVSPTVCLLGMGGMWMVGVLTATGDVKAEGLRNPPPPSGFTGHRTAPESIVPPPPHPSTMPQPKVAPVEGLRRHGG